MVINNNVKTYAYNRVIRKVLIFLMLFFSYAGITNAEMIPTIHSVTNGGSWYNPDTWNEGRLPNSDDIVQINGIVDFSRTIEIGGMQITGSGKLLRTNCVSSWCSPYLTLKIKGNLENNGRIGDDNTRRYYQKFYIETYGETINKGTIDGLEGFNIHGNIKNIDSGIWNGKIELYKEINSIEQNGLLAAEMKMMEDVSLTGTINIGSINTNRNTLYIDGTKDNYIGIAYGFGKILSLNSNGDGESLKVGILKYIETNIENLEVSKELGSVTARKISGEGILYGNFNIDSLEVTGKLELQGHVDISGDLRIAGNGELYRSLCSSRWCSPSLTLKIQGNLENNGRIGHDNKRRSYQKFYIETYGETINKGTIDGLEGFNIHGNIKNIDSGIWNGKIELYKEINSIEQNGLLAAEMKMMEDVSLTGAINIGSINTNRNTLYIDGTKDNYIGSAYGFGKILSLNSNGDGENIKVGILKYIETNIENLEVSKELRSVTARKISGEGILYGNFDIESLEVTGKLELQGHVDISGDLKITGSGELYRLLCNIGWCSPSLTLKIQGNLENNGRIGHDNKRGYYQKFYIETYGETINKGTIDGLEGFNIHGNIKNIDSGIWNGKIELYKEINSIEQNGLLAAEMKMMEDVSLTGAINIGSINTNRNTLYIDGTKDNYIGSAYGFGKILSLNSNGDGESLKVGILKYIETNIENLEVSKELGNITGRKITGEGILSGNLDIDSLEVTGKLELQGYVDISGDLKITGSGELYRLLCDIGWCPPYLTLKIQGNLENNGRIGHDNKRGYYQKFYIDIFKDLVNTGNILGVSNTYLHGSIENTGNIGTTTYLSWEPIPNYSSYILSITGQEDITVNATNYKIDNTLATTDNLLWRVKGKNSSSESGYTNPKCINVEGCVTFHLDVKKAFSYSNIEENNSNVIMALNIPSEELIWKKVEKVECSMQNEIVSENNIIEDKDAGDPVTLSSGEFTYANTLMYHNSIGIPFEFKINYRNQVLYNGPIGYNFDFNYNKFLKEDEKGDVNYHDGGLGVYKFVKTATGFTYTGSLDAELTQLDGKYSINLSNIQKLEFGENLKLSKIIDNNNNFMIFEYDDENKLGTITDTLNRRYSLFYKDNSRLDEIVDFNGNKVEFTYYLEEGQHSSENDLYVIRTRKGEIYKDIRFEYTTGENHTHKHNITKLIDSENNTYVENTYNSNDMVSSQRFGNGIISYDYTLDNEGKISQNKVIDRNGNTTIYTYDENGNTLKKEIKTDSISKIYTYKYNEDNKVIEEVHPMGNKYTFKYDDRGNMVEKTSIADGLESLVETYGYHYKFNKLISQKQANGLKTHYNLDVKGNVISKFYSGVYDFEGNYVYVDEKYDYNDLGELVSKLDPNGNITTFKYSNGNLIEMTKVSDTEEKNIVTKFEYDIFGNLIKSTDGEGNIAHMTYNDFNLIKSMTTNEGIKTEFIHNKLNKKVKESIILKDNSLVTKSYEYDILDEPIKEISDLDASRQSTKVIGYDANSNIIKTINPNGLITSFVYDESNNIIKKTVNDNISNSDILTSAPNGEPQITIYEYDLNNNLIKQTNPNGVIISYEYDLLNRLVKTTNSDNSYIVLKNDELGNPIQHLVYNSENKLLKTQDVVYDKLSREIEKTIENITTKTKYDSVGNVVEVIDPKGNKTTNSFDEFNRLVKTTDSLGNIVKNIYNKNDKVIEKQVITNDGTTVKTNYEYDSDNRLVKETDNDGNPTSYTYNNLNQIVTKTDANSVVTSYSYDYRGKVLSETITPSVTSEISLQEGDLTTKYKYNVSGNLIELTDTKGNVTTYEYDIFNRLVKQTYPDNSSVSLEYDISGNLIKKTDANGTIVENTYDNLNRLTSRSITNGEGVEGVSSESYIYDDLGRLVSADDSSDNTVSFEYDSLDRLVSESNGGKTVSYDYDSNGNMTDLITPESREFVYSYDVLNRLTSIVNGSGSLVDYNYSGLNLAKKSYYNGTSTSYDYDSLLRLKTIDYSIEGLDDYVYSYDAVSNITSNGLKDYSYDSLNQLTKVTNTASGTVLEDYGYDAMGNRDNYDTNVLNQYTGFSGSTIVYGKAGNLKQNDKFNFVYDYKNRLVRVDSIETGNIIKYEYDVLGRRVSEEKTDKTTEFVYSNNDIVSEYITASGATVANEYVYGLGVDDVLISFRESETYFYHKDHIRTVMGTTDSSGTLINSYKYDSFGNIESYIGEITNTRLFSGREYDFDTGLYYNRARYYSPEMGRFIGRDPIDVGDDVNLYRYCGNNGVRFVDPMGTDKQNIEGNIFYDIKAFLGLNFIGMGGEAANLNISTHMLAKFMYGDGSSEYYGNNHWISQKVKDSDFYKSELKVAINTTLEKGKYKYGGTGDIGENVFDDFGTSFGTVNWEMKGKRKDNGDIEVNFHIKDTYKYYKYHRNGLSKIDTIPNNLGKYYQDRGYGTPFEWELNITEDFTY